MLLLAWRFADASFDASLSSARGNRLGPQGWSSRSPIRSRPDRSEQAAFAHSALKVGGRSSCNAPGCRVLSRQSWTDSIPILASQVRRPIQSQEVMRTRTDRVAGERPVAATVPALLLYPAPDGRLLARRQHSAEWRDLLGRGRGWRVRARPCTMHSWPEVHGCYKGD